MSMDRRELLQPCLRSAAGGVILAIAICGPIAAHEYEVGKITVEHPWLRAPNDGETSTPLFMIIENKGDAPEKLVGAQSDKIGKVVLHADPLRIVVPHGIVVPPHATVTLEPGGPHIDLRDVKKMNPVGWGCELTLIFEKAGELTIDASVEAPDAKHAHDAEATERWGKAHGAQKAAERAAPKEAEPAAHEEHHNMHADHEQMHADHEHMHDAHESTPEDHQHVSAEAPDPDVAGADHSKLNHGVLGHAPSAPDGN